MDVSVVVVTAAVKTHHEYKSFGLLVRKDV